jgi:hypothetical protein
MKRSSRYSIYIFIAHGYNICIDHFPIKNPLPLPQKILISESGRIFTGGRKGLVQNVDYFSRSLILKYLGLGGNSLQQNNGLSAVLRLK